MVENIDTAMSLEENNDENQQCEAKEICFENQQTQQDNADDNDDEIELEAGHNQENSSRKFSDLIDSDSSDSDHNSEDPTPTRLEQNTGKEDRKNKPQRNSKKKAQINISAIRSETQRLKRERHLSIPYHKPKNYTLRDFMNRKTIAKPTLADLKQKNTKPIMSEEELKKFAQHLEEKAKEATEFFKGESEDEHENENKQNGNHETRKDDHAEGEKGEDSNGKNEPGADGVIEGAFNQNPNSFPTTEIGSDKPRLTLNAENLRKLILESAAGLPPKSEFKGDHRTLIDLETGDVITPKPSGVDELLNRFLKNLELKPKTPKSVSILSTENGKVEMSTSIMNVDEEDYKHSLKPGAAFFKLKEVLKQMIVKKRKEELLKKIETAVSENKKLHEETAKYSDEEDAINELEEEIEADDDGQLLSCGSDADDEQDDTDEEEKESSSGTEQEQNDEIVSKMSRNRVLSTSDDKSDDKPNQKNKKDEKTFIIINKPRINENPDSKKSRSRVLSTSDDSDEENESLDNKKSRSRVLSTFCDSSEKNESLDNKKSRNRILSTSDDSDEENEENEKALITVDKPEISESKDTRSEDVMIDLSFNSFNETQCNEAPVIPVLTQLPKNHLSSFVNEDELMELCSGKFEDEIEKEYKPHIDNEDNESESDHSMDEKEKENEQENQDEDDEEEVDEQIETYIDYDSEENEIEVQWNKKDRLKKAQDFLENEAELSESEWDSTDEDEKDLDKYDIELGDEDEFDSRKLQKELEKIHLEKLLVDDARKIKKIQELLFEDDEGAERQRQFRWKNTENGFSLDEANGTVTEGNGDDPEDCDEINEELWRKMRHEREQILKDKENEDETIRGVYSYAEEAKVENLSVKKITIIKPKVDIKTNTRTDSSFLIPKMKMNSLKGSFLVRDSETLSKLATLTKSGQNESDGDSVQIKTLKAKNFVFTILTEDSEKATIYAKRKLADVDVLSNQHKRPKVNGDVENNKKRLIDHLV